MRIGAKQRVLLMINILIESIHVIYVLIMMFIIIKKLLQYVFKYYHHLYQSMAVMAI